MNSLATEVEGTAWEPPVKRFLKAVLPAAIIMAVAFLIRENLNWSWGEIPKQLDELGEQASAGGLTELGEYLAQSTSRFWGPEVWVFPALCFLLLGSVQRPKMRWICDAAILAWVGWITRHEHDWSMWWTAIFVVPVMGLWTWLALLRTHKKELRALRLFIPCAFVIVAGSCYNLLNTGVLVVQLGGWWANFISSLAFLAVWLCAWAWAPFVSSGMRMCWRVIHFGVAGVVTFLLADMSIRGFQWMALSPDGDPLINAKGTCAVVYLIVFFALMLVYAAIAFGLLTMKDPVVAATSRRLRATSGG